MLLAVFVIVSGSVNAAQIEASHGLEFLVINGKGAKEFGPEANKRLDLISGNHQIVARFDGEVKRGSKTTIFTSKPYVFDVEIENEDLVLVVPKFRSESQAKAFFRNPEWGIETVSTGKTAIILGVLMKGSGFGSYSNMEEAVANYNRQNGIIIEGGEAKDLEDVLVNIDDKGNVDITGDAATQLKLWYTKATNEEKKAFKRWMIDQDF
ncbi:YccT family protein [Enterovibrio norvegicus]|uniref:YccT family protein n=1 Tax=Enterovibrio norvegicus TaxID=188144 RepID=UPI001F527F3D|nr:DUF2057 domain-containing protein [Enterovibrio norvegicus]